MLVWHKYCSLLVLCTYLRSNIIIILKDIAFLISLTDSSIYLSSELCKLSTVDTNVLAASYAGIINTFQNFLQFNHTCKYLWMYHEAVFPSLTDSTVVCATPAISPPQNIHGSLHCIVSLFTSGKPHLFNFTGFIASTT